MTPGEFPSHGAYLTYVRECEESQLFDNWDYGTTTFDEVTAIVEKDHLVGCGELDGVTQYCCPPDPDGLSYFHAMGSGYATNHTAPMFMLKDDTVGHDPAEPGCGWCYPVEWYAPFYTSAESRLTPEEAEERFWNDIREQRRHFLTSFATDGKIIIPDKNPKAHP